MKVICIVLLTVAAVAAEETFCTPGSFFKMNCNTCTCSADGKRAACTDMACPTEEKMDSIIRTAPKPVCTPRAQFLDYCNTCTCADNGMSFACTRMMCNKDIWNPDGSLKVLAKESEGQKKQVCEPLKQFKNYCNTCFCNEDGQSFACTRMMCDRAIWNIDGTLIDEVPKEDVSSVAQSHNELDKESKKVCEPLSKFKDYCNNCFCDEDGLSYSCTRMYCDRTIWNRDGTLKIETPKEVDEPKKVCEPLSQFKDYCNSCFCDEDGLSYSCTRMFCGHELWNQDGTMKIAAEQEEEKEEESKPTQTCKPYSHFKSYCNLCTCGGDGQSIACTRMACDKNIWNQDGSLKIMKKSDKVAPTRVCEPKSHFKNYCNTCACSEDGLSFACTRMLCDHEIWSKDGSLKVVKKEQICEPGRTYNPDKFSTCRCNKEGTSAMCTLIQ